MEEDNLTNNVCDGCISMKTRDYSLKIATNDVTTLKNSEKFWHNILE